MSILTYQVALLGSEVVSAPEERVFSTFDYFVKGCLIPLIVRTSGPMQYLVTSTLRFSPLGNVSNHHHHPCRTQQVALPWNIIRGRPSN